MSKQKKPEESVDLAERTTRGLRAALFDELDGLRKGTVNATRANAVAKLATTIVETARLDLDAAKYAERNKLGGRPAKTLPNALELTA